MPWIRVLAAVAFYLVVALVTSALIRRRGKNLKEMGERGSSGVLVLGACANLVVLAAVLLFIVFLDKRSIGALGLGFTGRDLVFTVASVGVTFASAVGFLAVLHRRGTVEVTAQRLPPGSAGRLGALMGVLFVVVLQEEVLYRGYVTVNLLRYGPIVVLLISTLVFTAIHLPTNRVSRAQITSWACGGLILGWVYLESGSIWTPVALHFAMDLANVVAFGVAGELALADLSRPLTDLNRTIYRVGYVALVGVVALSVYGIRLAPRWRG